MGGLAKDLAFLILMCGFIKSIKGNSDFDGILKDFEAIIEKHKPNDKLQKAIGTKLNVIHKQLMRITAQDITIELKFATAYLILLKYAKNERGKVKIDADIESAVNRHEYALYGIMDKIQDEYESYILINTHKFCHSLISECL